MRTSWLSWACLVLTVVVASCTGATTSDTSSAESFESLVGGPVPDAAEDVAIVSEGRMDPFLTARFELPVDDVAEFLAVAGFDEPLAAGVVEIDRVPDQLTDEFESIDEFGSAARDDGSQSVAVHVTRDDPAVVFVQAFGI